MKPQYLFFLLISIVVSIQSVSATCAPGERHCQNPEERNVDSNGEGIDTGGDISGAGTPETEPPAEDDNDEPINGDKLGGGTTPSDESSENRLGTGAITALSLGGGLLLVAAAIFKMRKKPDSESDETNTGMDFDTSAAPSMGDDTA